MNEIIDKLLDVNSKCEGVYSINITSNGFIVLKRFTNPILVTEDVQELREALYKEILKEQ